jgi:hypothetical protein
LLLLTTLAGGPLVFSGGQVTVLVPLFAIGVFIGFTLCQASMPRHRWTLRSSRGRARPAVNTLGTVLTTEKFTEGAWLIVVSITRLAEQTLCTALSTGDRPERETKQADRTNTTQSHAHSLVRKSNYRGA